MDPWRIEHLTEEAIDALERGDADRAVELTAELVEAAPDNALVRTIRAKALLQTGMLDGALDESRRAVELEPENVQAQVVHWLAAWQSGRLTWAQEAMERALALSDRRPGLLVDFAWFMAAERGPRLAEDAALEATAAAPQSSTAWAALGLAQLRLRRRGDAEESLKRALKLDPNDPYAQSAMVSLLQERRQDHKAVALAHILEDTPGTEAFVAEVRREAKKRQIGLKLAERNVYPIPFSGERRRRWIAWLWLVLAWLAMGGFLALLFQPRTVVGAGFCAAAPAAFLWVMKKLVG